MSGDELLLWIYPPLLLIGLFMAWRAEVNFEKAKDKADKFWEEFEQTEQD